MYIDSSSTTIQMVDYITAKDIFIITNSIAIAQLLVLKRIRTIISAGEIDFRNDSVQGPLANEILGRLYFDKVFLGANGLSLNGGYTCPSMDYAHLKRIARQNSKQAFVLADSSKLGVLSLASFAKVDEAVLITDSLSDGYRMLKHMVAPSEENPKEATIEYENNPLI